MYCKHVHSYVRTCLHVYFQLILNDSCTDVLSGRDTSPTIAGSEPPLQTGSTAPPSEEQTSTDLSASPPPTPNPLPTSFDISVGVHLANTVRSQTGVSFSESQAAAETTLRFVAQEIPQLADVMEGLVKALEASQVCLGLYVECVMHCRMNVFG